MEIPISQLTEGVQLAEDVLTPRGHVLLVKGKRIEQRDLDLLQAFKVPTVKIESEQTIQNNASMQLDPSFYQLYDELLQIFKKLFPYATPGMSIPLLEIRALFEEMINHINEYKPLTFRPLHFEMEDYLYHHSIMTALTSYKLAEWHQLPKKDFIPIGISGLLHDIGSFAVDQNIMMKQGKLTKEEQEEVKKHVLIGYQILKNISGLNEGIKLCALQHHERMDGSGYPLGIVGDQIHLYARIVAIADLFHAMTNERVYRQKQSPYLVLEELYDQSFGHYDPSLVQTFIQQVTLFQIGTIVRLSDQSIGEIVFTDRNHPTRPMVKVNDQIFSLLEKPKLYIEEVIRT